MTGSSYTLNVRGLKVRIEGGVDDLKKKRLVAQVLRQIALDFEHDITPALIEHED